jgi:hypothetical protein
MLEADRLSDRYNLRLSWKLSRSYHSERGILRCDRGIRASDEVPIPPRDSRVLLLRR